ncbi:MAG: hypothetical protein QMD96_07880 [Anaerosomatales bacterium]|nr:hypothetical protein [Anaerosomatales bacterium]
MLDSVTGTAHAAVACAFGLAFGLGFAALSRFAVSFVRPGRLYAGLAVVSSLTFARLVLSGVLLYVCSAVAPASLVPFGVSLVAAFLVTTVVEGLREIRSVPSGVTA